jgi:peptidoglycan/LPS O-acetylase OafA/YrhL
MAQQIEREVSRARVSGDGYRADIDGLRAVAVLSVLLYHAGFGAFRAGFIGVDIFFVISGFLIGGHIYDEELAGRFTFLAFYCRRARRILPALYFVICAVILLGVLILSPNELRSAATEAIATLLSASNLFFWKAINYFAVAADQRTLLMTWSLGVEEQFYLVVPLLMVFLMRSKSKTRLVPVLAAVSALSFFTACYQSVHAQNAAFYLLPARGWELFAGVLLAVIANHARQDVVQDPVRRKVTQNVLSGLGLLLVLLPIFFLPDDLPFPGIGALPSVLGSVLVLSAPDGWVNKKILTAGIMRYVGRISYSLYLWHWPLLTLARIVLGTDPTRAESTAILAISLLAAAASYRWVEQPFRAIKTPGRTLLIRYAALATLLIFICLAIRLTFGIAFRAPELAVEERLDWSSSDPCIVEPSADRASISLPCFENTGRPALMIWGDSHAGALAPALRQQAHEAGYDFIESAKSSCPPLANTARHFSASPDETAKCVAFNNNVLKSIEANQKIQVVALASYWSDSLVDPYVHNTGWIVTGSSTQAPKPTLETSEKMLSDALIATISALQKAGKRVLVLQDVPVFSEDPLWRFRTARLPLRAWLVNRLRPRQPIDPGADVEMYPSAYLAARLIIEDATKTTGASLFDLESALRISSTTYRYRDSVHSFYEDNQHLTLAGGHAALAGLTLPGPRKE